jgi:hypothetical protein
MRDNMLFFNVEEEEKENIDEKIFQILEEKLEIPDARNKIKIDRTHRVARKRNVQRKPRAIVVKFNYFRDREFIRQNARKLRGTRIGIAEQFPEEIEKIIQLNFVSGDEEGQSSKTESTYGPRQIIY